MNIRLFGGSSAGRVMDIPDDVSQIQVKADMYRKTDSTMKGRDKRDNLVDCVIFEFVPLPETSSALLTD